jgi:hypothetical protein
MSATKLAPDEELAGVGAQRGPGSAETYILLEPPRRAPEARMYLPFAILRGSLHYRALLFRQLI